jgi:hypothetical protein
MMNEEGAQPATDRMTSPPQSCYYASCESTPKWGVSSQVKRKNPDGSDLTLFTCDSHYDDLTGKLRSVGTKYSLFPVNGPHMVSPEEAEVTGDASAQPGMYPDFKTMIGKVLFAGTCYIVALIIGPFVILYYGGKWIFGWRPPSEGL